jgi:ribosomal-protein-alanine N-acetyltransferase
MNELPHASLNNGVFRDFPVLHTSRLLLREILPGDAADIFEQHNNTNVNRFVAREEMKAVKEAEKFVTDTRKKYKTQQGIMWAAQLRGSGNIIGTCGFTRIEHANLRAELAGELSPEWWGKNIAMEGVKEIVKFGMQILNLHSIETRIQSGNLGAVFLMEKLGFVKEGHFRERIFHNGKFHDLLVYSLIKGTRSY